MPVKIICHFFQRPCTAVKKRLKCWILNTIKRRFFFQKNTITALFILRKTNKQTTTKSHKTNKGLIDTEPKLTFKLILCWNSVISIGQWFCKLFYTDILVTDVSMSVKGKHVYSLLNFIVLHVVEKATTWLATNNFWKYFVSLPPCYPCIHGQQWFLII